MKVIKESKLNEKLEIPLNRGYFYCDLQDFDDGDSLRYLFQGTISNKEELRSIFNIRNGKCYLPKGTILVRSTDDNYYNYYQIKGTDKIIAIPKYSDDPLGTRVNAAERRYWRESFKGNKMKVIKESKLNVTRNRKDLQKELQDKVDLDIYNYGKVTSDTKISIDYCGFNLVDDEVIDESLDEGYYIDYDEIEKIIPDYIDCDRDSFGYVCGSADQAKKLVDIINSKDMGYHAERFRNEVHLNESLNEAFNIESLSRNALIDAIDEFYIRAMGRGWYINNDEDMDSFLLKNGANEDDTDPEEGFYSSMSNDQLRNVYQTIREYLKKQPDGEIDEYMYKLFRLKRVWVDESLNEAAVTDSEHDWAIYNKLERTDLYTEVSSGRLSHVYKSGIDGRLYALQNIGDGELVYVGTWPEYCKPITPEITQRLIHQSWYESLNEDIANLERVKDKKTVQNVVMADAEQFSKDKNTKETKKLTDPMELKNNKAFLGASKQPVPKDAKVPNEATNKMYKLSENLFEDAINEDYLNYSVYSSEDDFSDSLDLFRSKQKAINYAKKYAEKNNTITQVVAVASTPKHKNPDLFFKNEPDLGVVWKSDGSINKDLDFDNYSDFNSDVYNAVADVMFKYRNKGVSEKDVDRAFEWFLVHFFDFDWDEDNANESFKEDINQSMKVRRFECPNCGYLMKKAPRCPECGQLIDISNDCTESLKESIDPRDREELLSRIQDLLSDYVSYMDEEDARSIASELEQIMIDHVEFINELRAQNGEDLEEDLNKEEYVKDLRDRLTSLLDDGVVNGYEFATCLMDYLDDNQLQEFNAEVRYIPPDAEMEEDLKEATNKEKEKLYKQQRKGLWDRVYSELSTGVDTAVEGPHKIKAGKNERYDDIFIPDNGIGAYAPNKERLNFAKKVADYFGLECKINAVPGNAGTDTAYKAVIVIPDSLVNETEEQTKARLNK